MCTCRAVLSQPVHTCTCRAVLSQPVHMCTCRAVLSQPVHMCTCGAVLSQPVHMGTYRAVLSQPVHMCTCRAVLSQPVHSAHAEQFSLNQCTFALVERELLCSSLSTCAPDGHLLRVTIPDAVLIQFDLLRMSKI